MSNRLKVFLLRIRLVAAHSIRNAIERLQRLGYTLAQSVKVIALARQV